MLMNMAKLPKLIHKNGQGLIEVVVSVGLILLILAGVVPLMLTSLASKGKTFERKKAVELAEKAMETAVNEAKNNAGDFWQKVAESQIDPDCSADVNYRCQRTYKCHADDCRSCSDSAGPNCADVTVVVSWSGSDDPAKKVTFSRFFAK